MREYALKSTKLSKYAPFRVSNPRAGMSKFVMGVSYLVFQEFKMTMFIKEVDISRLMMYAKQIENEKMWKKARESKRAHANICGFYYQRSNNDSNGRVQGRQRYSNQGKSYSTRWFIKGKGSNLKVQERGWVIKLLSLVKSMEKPTRVSV